MHCQNNLVGMFNKLIQPKLDSYPSNECEIEIVHTNSSRELSSNIY